MSADLVHLYITMSKSVGSGKNNVRTYEAVVGEDDKFHDGILAQGVADVLRESHRT